MARDIHDIVSALKATYAASPLLLRQSRERLQNRESIVALWSGICHHFSFPDRVITFGFADEGVAGADDPHDLTVTTAERSYQLDLANAPLSLLACLPTAPLDQIAEHILVSAQEPLA